MEGTTTVSKIKQTNALYLDATKDVDGQRVFARSEAIHKVAGRISHGVMTGDRTQWRIDPYSCNHIPGFGDGADSDVRKIFLSTKLNEGVTVDVARPMNPDEFKAFVNGIAVIANQLVQQYCSAVRIKLTMSVDEPLIRFTDDAGNPLGSA